MTKTGLPSLAVVAVLSVAVLLGSSVTAEAFTLEETVRQTLETHPRIMAARHELAAAREEVRQARAAYLPKLSLSAGVGEEQRSAPATGNEEVTLTRQELALQAEQLVFDGFGTTAEIKRQKARLDSLSLEVEAVAQDLALRGAEVYLNVLRQAALLDLARSTQWEHQNIYDQMKLRSDSGVGSRADLDQIAARLALANANMWVAQNNLADAQANFASVAGFFPNLENMRLPVDNSALPADLQAAIDLAVSQHPTLQAAVVDVGEARAQHKAAASRYWPTLKVEAEQRWDEDIGGIEGEDEDRLIALRLNMNLFNGGADRARRKQTAQLTEQAIDIRNQTRRQVVESMTLSWNAFSAIDAQKVYLQQHFDAAKATKEAYIKQFNIGKRTLLDLLNTENEVVEARRALVNAEHDHWFARYRIHSAAGELLRVFAVAAPGRR